MTTTPHLAVPFRIVGASALTVEQDTLEEIAQNVSVVVGTRTDERLVVPEFGVSDPTFSLAVDTADIDSAVVRWEPRAMLEFEMGGPGSERDLRIRVGRTE